jgi:uncharacterized protein (DUF1501 family)
MSHTRRDFLRAALGASTLVSLGPAAPAWLIRSTITAASRGDRDTVLVVLQLTGGNDGLNTVVPYADDQYGRNRTTLRLPTTDLHRIDSSLGFHPRMEAFLRLYKDGYLSIIHGVGCPNPDQDHDRAMRMWHTAHPGSQTHHSASGGPLQRPEQQTGWLGRVVDRAWSSTAPDTTAVFVGPIVRPFALNAENAVVPSIRSVDDLTVHQESAMEVARPPSAGIASEGGATTVLQFLRQSTLDARAKSERVKTVVQAAGGSSDYPSFGLAGDLRMIAQLIRADIGIRIFFVELGGGGIGGFDNHANQLGNHCALLHQMAESVAAFIYDLKRDKQLDRVLLMTFSEFGRTVKENGRRGTDHGAAAPVFLAGGKVKGGLLGPHPSLSELEKGALKTHTDFRRVYATMLDRWLGFDSASVLGSRFEPLDVL